ncbi:unnamed protein product [Ectocarpus sp. CCAP 1310/34]|nr:unnamed protein product [Ectocarpus sp. CCAP 1310/34]
MAAARREEEARQAAEKAAEEVRIEELVNEKVAARMEQMMEEKLAKKMAEMEVRQRAEQLSTEDLRSGNEEKGVPHQQATGGPSPNPSADELANAIATAMAGRLQTSSGDIGAVPHPATLRMTESRRIEPWDGVFKSGDNKQQKLLIFRSSMVARFAQEDVHEVVMSNQDIPVGRQGISMVNLKTEYGDQKVAKAVVAWNLLITSISFMPILSEIVSDGSPSGGWRIFLKYYEPQAKAEKKRLLKEYHSFAMHAGENPQEYFGRFSILRSRLASHGTVYPDNEANDHLVSALSSDYKLEKKLLDRTPDLNFEQIEDSVKEAHTDLVRAREEEQKSGVGHAFVASGAPRGDGRVPNGSSGNGDGQDGKGDGRSRSDETRRDRRCHVHPRSNHTNAECYQQQRDKERKQRNQQRRQQSSQQQQPPQQQQHPQQPQQQQYYHPRPQQQQQQQGGRGGGGWGGGPQHGPHGGRGAQQRYGNPPPPHPQQQQWRPPHGHANVMHHEYGATPYGGPANSSEYGGWEQPQPQYQQPPPDYTQQQQPYYPPPTPYYEQQQPPPQPPPPPTFQQQQPPQLQQHSTHAPPHSSPPGAAAPAPGSLHFLMARFVSAGEIIPSGVVASTERESGNGFALSAQNPLSRFGREKFWADSGATNTFVSSSHQMFDLRPVPTGKEYIQVGNGTYLRVQCVGKVNMAFHMQDQGGERDFRVQMSDVYVVPGITFNLFSLHHTQRKQRIVLDETGVHLFDGRLSFAYSDVGCSLWATRLPQDYCGRAVTSSPDAPPRVSAQASPPSIGTGFVAATPSLFQSAGTGTSASATSGFQSVASAGVVPATSGFQSVAPAGVVPSTADVQPTGSDGVVPSSSSVPSTTSGVVLPICAFPSVDVDPTPTTIPDFQPVITAAVESSSIVSPPAVELTDFREIEINPLFSQDALPIMDMSMFLDVGLMDGKDTVPPGDFFPDALELAESADPPHLAFTVQHDDLEVLSGFLSECNEQQAAAPPSLSHALAIIAPGASPFSVGKSTPTIDINLFHASTGHVNEFLMRETAKQQGVRLVGELQPCVGCVEAKGRRAPVPRRGTRAAVPFGKVHIDLTGPFTEAMDGSRYLIMFVDSASRWQRGYGMRAKSDTLKYVKRFLADMNGMGTPGCFRMDNGGEFTGAAFIEFCDAAGIRREYTAPDTPKQNAVAESAIWRAMKGGHAARRHILSMAHVDLASVPNIGANGQRLWLSSALWASGCFNRSATKANQGWMSPFEAFFGRKPPLTVVPFFQEGRMRVKRATKADVQSARCFYLHGANNHSTSTAVVLRADTGRLALTNNVVWVNRRAGAPAPVPAIGGGSSVTAAPSPAAAVPAADAAQPPPPRTWTYYPPAPATTAAPPPPPSIFTGSSAPSPISVAPSSAPPSTAATPPRSPPGLPPPPPKPASAAVPAPPHPPLSKRAVKELGREDTRVHGRTRGDGVRFMDEQQKPPSPPGGGTALHHRLELLDMMDKDTLISSLATREAVDQGRRDLPPPPQPDPSPGGRGSGGAVGAGGPVDSGGGGRPQMFATMFATREDVDAALRAERPPDKMPDLPHCMASDLREPKTFNEAMRSLHSELWGDAVDREFYGLLDAGTFHAIPV